MSERKTNPNLIWIALVVLLLLGLVYVVSNTGQRHNWYEGYRVDNLEPYGTQVFSELLKQRVGDDQFYFWGDSTRTLPERDALYLFVGNYAYLDSAEIADLLASAESGNQLFFSVRTLNQRLLSPLLNSSSADGEVFAEEWIEEPGDSLYADEMYPDEEYYEYDEYETADNSYPFFTENILTDTTASFSLKNHRSKFEYDFLFENYRYSRDWHHFGKYPLQNSLDSAVALGYLNDSLVNYLSFDYGKGKIYLHLAPLVFSNYALTDSLHFVYVNACMSDIRYTSVIWDEQNKIYQPMDQGDFERSYQPNETPLNFIFSQRSLRWAWYAMLITILLYLLFGARRTQRIQPVKRALANTSLQFATALSELYLQQKDHRKIAMLQWRLFLNSIRRNYGLPTAYKTEEEKTLLIQRLSLKSGVEQTKVEELFEAYRKITIVFKVSDEELSAFYLKLKEFKNERK